MSDDTAVNTETEEREPGSTRSSALDLGDITQFEKTRRHDAQVGVEGDDIDYYRFTLSEAREVRLGLLHRQGDAALSLEDADGTVLGRAVEYGYGSGSEAVVRTLGPGTYYVRVQADGTDVGEHVFRYRSLEAYAAYSDGGGWANRLGMPSFGEWSYALSLSENAPGGVDGVSLGQVAAVDPHGEELSYRIVGGNGSGLFAIDAVSGELFYVGGGEDYESGAGPYELRVRASDGTHTIDATVTVAITDAAEAPAFGEQNYGFALAENADGRVNRLSLGAVTATDPDGDTVRYSLSGGNDSGLFAIDETSGELYYVGPGEDYESGAGPYELTVRASDAAHTVDTTVTVTVTNTAEAPAFAEQSYAFALSENTDGSVSRVSLGSVTATDPDGDAVRYRLAGGNESGLFAIDGASGELSYVGGGEDYESGAGPYELTVRASDGTDSMDATVTVAITNAAEAPAFGEQNYGFALAENADGRVNRLSLGAVEATDPDGDAVRYRLAGGNVPGLFVIDETSGELYYVGGGEDYESGVTSHELTVQASDGAHTIDTTVTVTVTDAAEAPAFDEESYAFELAENTDGSVDRIALGVVTATDPDGDAVRYRLASGNESGLFAIDEASGELYYVGWGEDFEGSAGPYELTVRTSDGTHPVDTMVTVTVVDDPSDSEKTTVAQGRSEPAGDDLPAGRGTSGEVHVNAEPVDGTLRSPSDRDWFAVTLAPGRTYVFNLEGDTPRGGIGTAPVIRALRDANGDPVASIVGGAEVRYTTDAAAAEAVYYIEVGGGGDSGRGTSATRGVGTLGGVGTRSVVDTRSSSDGGSGYRLWANDITEARDVTDDYRSDVTTTGEVAVGGSVTGEIERSGDRDWFAVTLAAGRQYRIDLEGSETGVGTLPDPYLRGVHDANGNLIDGTTDDYGGAGFNSRVLFTAPEDATYYVATGAWRDEVGTYTLSMTDATDGIPDDFAAGTGTTGTVAVGGTATGAIETRGDRDWFAVTLEAGRQYRIDLEGSATGAGTLRNPYLRGVHDADGNLIGGTANDNGGAGYNSRVHFTAPEDGTYYVATGGDGDSEGTYTLSVAVDDYTSGTDTTGTVMVGGTVTGEIETSGDRDWFAVTLEAGRLYRIDLEGSQTGAGTLPDPYLHGVHDANGVLLDGTTNDDIGGIYRYYGGGNNSQVFFTAAASATYYVAAGGNGQSQGTYELSVTEVIDDFADNTGTTGTLEVGKSITGEINYPYDRDWFAVTLEADKTYRIDLERSGTGAGAMNNPYLHGVHDADGVLLAGTTNDDVGGSYQFGEGYNSRVFFAAPEAATYYVAAGGDGQERGTYRLSVREFPDDFAAGTGTSGTVEVGGTATGKVEFPDDTDWFAVTLAAGTTYRIELEGSATAAGTLRNPYLLGVHDADGNLIDGTTNFGGGVGYNSRVLFTAPEDATYYVAAGARNKDTTGTYRLSVRDAADDFAAGIGTTGTVEVGGTVIGEIETSRDRDWFAVALEAGRTCWIDLKGSGTGSGTLRDPYLRGIHDANGVLLDYTKNDNGGAGDNSRVSFTAPDAATYYVAAGAWSRYEVGTYMLSVRDVTDGVPDDFAAGTGTTGTVEVGGSVTGEIEYRYDRDWFAVTLAAGTTYRIDLEGRDTRAGYLPDPYLFGVHDADGNLIGGTTNDNSGAGHNSRVYFTAPDAATYYVAVGAFRHLEGTYRLSVRELPTVEVGGSVAGKIEFPGEVDWFAVTLAAGQVYRIDLEGFDTVAGSRAGVLRHPYLRGVHDADGNLIGGTTNKYGGSGTNSRVTFTAPEDATYYVVASGRDRDKGGTYTLSVTDVTDGVPDDFAAGTDTTGRVAVGGSATGKIDYREDRDWFAVTLEEGGTYRIDLEGWSTGAGTLRLPNLYGVHDADGNRFGGTTNFGGGTGLNSRVTFTADADDTYYVAAGAGGNREGTYTLSVEEVM